MGQKVHPYIQRVGFIKPWRSQWFAKKDQYTRFVEEDYHIRKFIKDNYKQAAISDIFIERLSDKVRVIIYTARPGVIIGRHGADIKRLIDELGNITGKEVVVERKEIEKPEIEAELIAENIAFQIQKRVNYRRAVKRAIEQAMAGGVEGIKIIVSGRLAGAEISRSETYKEGKIPLQTLRADIDYGFAESLTTYGLIGVKVWVYKGDALLKKEEKEEMEEAE
ncbi:MAG: 30S ribosomal protein S3 [Candidatus Omnitrophica bacterium]|nr:30S ribosomal protein S3 [Candidatus Omnitrophota bacterium]